MLRFLGFLTAVVCAGAAAVLTWPSAFGLERTFPIAQMVAFRPVVTAVLAFVAVVLLLCSLSRVLRRLVLAAALVCVIGAVSNAAIVTGRGIGETELPEKTETSLRVLAWNTAGAATSPQVIAETAVAMNADIVTLPETTIATGTQVAIAMGEMGQPMWAHHTQFGSDEIAAWSTTILISSDLADYSVTEETANGSSNTSSVPSVVAVPVSGDGPIVVGAHAVAPREDAMDRWEHDLQWLADQCNNPNVIMAGDFNATLDHMSRLGVNGGDLGQCTDAAAVTGNGAVGTWPTALPALVGAPVDHVMFGSAWKATGSIVLTTLDSSGSDHRPLIVQLDRAD